MSLNLLITLGCEQAQSITLLMFFSALLYLHATNNLHQKENQNKPDYSNTNHQLFGGEVITV